MQFFHTQRLTIQKERKREKYTFVYSDHIRGAIEQSYILSDIR